MPASRARESPRLRLAHPPRADDEVGLVAHDRLDQPRHLAGIVLAVGIERHDDVDAQPLGDQVAGLERRSLAAVDRVADDVGAEPRRDGRGAVARAVVDDQDVRRQPGDLRRDLGEDGRQVVGLVEGRDADEDAAPPAPTVRRLDLGRRQGAHQAADPLVGAIGPAERVEQQQVGDGDRR